ncbi:MAG TPA: enoyl-CoA hydratase-related protein [Acidimicrobiales bacterium]|nr:enoyl-CoA hydratase-related protein [Acidimicrobiales bacterium]
MSYDCIRTEPRGEVLLITLDRPDRLNAWTPTMGDELARAIGSANQDPGVGAVVLTGAGRGFCAGADMQDTFSKRIAGQDPGADTGGGFGGMSAGLDWVQLCRTAKPLIAAVNGACVGVGLTQILSFDVIVASRRARFGMGFIKMGLVPELASTRLLADRVGPGRARSLALTGDLWAAERAHSAGLVDHLVEPEELLDEALGLAGRIAANPGRQVQWTKELLTANALEPDTALVQRRESELLRQCWVSEEHAEAVAAFLQKRPAVFPPRPEPSAG